MFKRGDLLLAGSGALAIVATGAYLYNGYKKKWEVTLVNHESLEQFKARVTKTPASAHWNKIGVRNHFGVVAPVFSLRTLDSCGVGEYLDLLPLIEWAKSIGLDVIQLLPINDTSDDNSPFSPVSSFSLNPALISLKHLPNFDKQTPKMSEFINFLGKLNTFDAVQWKEVRSLKSLWLWDYFNQPEQQLTWNSTECQQFFEQNRSWIETYALFKVMKEKYQGKFWKEWPEVDFNNSEPPEKNKQQILQLLQDNRKKVNFHIFLQFLCNQQMKRVKQFAESNGIFLKGDIPFLVSPDSADVWANQSLFKLEHSAGAPPDMFSADGQNWGLPLYNWPKMEKAGFKWWKDRLKVASQYFHIYRIDHIVGFFRVWAVPHGKKGTEGFYEPAHKNLWIPQGEKLLRMMLSASDMLPIGEDLGAVPPEVRVSLQRLGICGTKVMRWERHWEKPGKPFISYEDYNLDSMTTVSTHDSETLDIWWRDRKDEANAYCEFKNIPFKESQKMDKELRSQLLRESNSTPSLFHINLLQEYLALHPSWVHQEIDKERINVPSTVANTNWSWRMQHNLRDLKEASDLNHSIKETLPTTK